MFLQRTHSYSNVFDTFKYVRLDAQPNRFYRGRGRAREPDERPTDAYLWMHRVSGEFDFSDPTWFRCPNRYYELPGSGYAIKVLRRARFKRYEWNEKRSKRSARRWSFNANRTHSRYVVRYQQFDGPAAESYERKSKLKIEINGHASNGSKIFTV